MKRLAAALFLGAGALAQTVNDLPTCAQTCLSNSTTQQTACQLVDLKCLCTSTLYVNSLSCCLATQCDTADQQKAITFNQAECRSVNETAPGFVGCSPMYLSSLVLVGGSPASLTDSAPLSTAVSMSTAGNSLVATITGSTASALASFSVTTTITAKYTPNSLLTGSCTVPHFAIISDINGRITEFPEVGCSPERPGCCPFPYSERAVLTHCPVDYFTTASGCCPTGYQIYYTAIGAETPCYTMPSVTHFPGSSPTISGVTTITEHVFTKQYILAMTQSGPSILPQGSIAGIAVNAVLFVLIILLVAWCIRRHRKREAEPLIPRNREMSEPELELAPRPFELTSPQAQHRPTSPGSRRSDWPMGSAGAAPPTYEDSRDRPLSVKPSALQELPGSTYIYEHHPAFNANGTAAASSGAGEAVSGVSSPQVSVVTPATPPRSPKAHHVSPKSPSTCPQTPASKRKNSPVISPLASPRPVLRK